MKFEIDSENLIGLQVALDLLISEYKILIQLNPEVNLDWRKEQIRELTKLKEKTSCANLKLIED